MADPKPKEMNVTFNPREGVSYVKAVDGYQVGGGVFQTVDGDSALIVNVCDFTSIEVQKIYHEALDEEGAEGGPVTES